MNRQSGKLWGTSENDKTTVPSIADIAVCLFDMSVGGYAFGSFCIASPYDVTRMIRARLGQEWVKRAPPPLRLARILYLPKRSVDQIAALWRMPYVRSRSPMMHAIVRCAGNFPGQEFNNGAPLNAAHTWSSRN